MRRGLRILELCLFSLAAWQQCASAQERGIVDYIQIKAPRTQSSSAKAREKIRKALDDLTHLEFVETPLTDVVDYLKDKHQIEIQVDIDVLEDDSPVTSNLRGISLDAALRNILAPRDRVFVIKDEVLLITTKEKAARDISLRAYDSSWAADRIPSIVAAISLVKTIGLPKGDDAAAVGEQFKIVVSEKAIAVRATALQHDAIERLLIEMRGIDRQQTKEAEPTKPQ